MFNSHHQEEPVRYNPQADPKVKQLAENHGRSMEAIHNRNKDLERQREGMWFSLLFQILNKIIITWHGFLKLMIV